MIVGTGNRILMTRAKQAGVLLLLLAVAGCGKNVATPEEPEKIAPELDGGLTWINSSALKLADLRGKVVLLDFFEYSCVNCIRTFPYLKEWQKRYAPDGLVIIGVHTPQYGFSMDPAHVYAGIQRLGLTFPIVVDSDSKIADDYQNRFWPRVFLIDQDGRISYEHTGEGGYAETEQTIQQLLGRTNPGVKFPPVMPPLRAIDKAGASCYPITAELYLGRLRGRLGNPEGASTNAVVAFHLPEQREEGRAYAAGDWSNQSEYLRHANDKDGLVDFVALKYRAVEVNVVMKPEDIYWLQVFVKQDGNWLSKDNAGEDVKFDDQGRSYVEVKSPRMYNLIASQPYGAYELRLYVEGKGLSVYSFSFGTCEIPQNNDKLRPDKETS